MWVLGRSRWYVGESRSPLAQRLQASFGVGKLGSLLGVSCWGFCPPFGAGIQGRASDVDARDLPFSGWLFAQDVRVLMIVSLQLLSFRFGVVTPHRRSISRIRRLSERAKRSNYSQPASRGALVEARVVQGSRPRQPGGGCTLHGRACAATRWCPIRRSSSSIALSPRALQDQRIARVRLAERVDRPWVVRQGGISVAGA